MKKLTNNATNGERSMSNEGRRTSIHYSTIVRERHACTKERATSYRRRVSHAARYLLVFGEDYGARGDPERFVVEAGRPIEYEVAGRPRVTWRRARGNCSGGEWRDRRRPTKCRKGLLSRVEVGRQIARAHDTRCVRLGALWYCNRRPVQVFPQWQHQKRAEKTLGNCVS